VQLALAITDESLLAFSPLIVKKPTTPGISGFDPNQGHTGDTIPISGLGFGATKGTGTVAFNGMLASVTFWSDTLIRAEVPEGDATGLVTVVTNIDDAEFGQIAVMPRRDFLNQSTRWSKLQDWDGTHSYVQQGTGSNVEHDFVVIPYSFANSGPSIGISAEVKQGFGSGTSILRAGILIGDATNVVGREFVAVQYDSNLNKMELIGKRAGDPGAFGIGLQYRVSDNLFIGRKPEAIGLAICMEFMTVWVKLDGVWDVFGWQYAKADPKSRSSVPRQTQIQLILRLATGYWFWQTW
jgi:hypothetical protein